VQEIVENMSREFRVTVENDEVTAEEIVEILRLETGPVEAEEIK
jgi:hypothetical protein